MKVNKKVRNKASSVQLLGVIVLLSTIVIMSKIKANHYIESLVYGNSAALLLLICLILLPGSLCVAYGILLSKYTLKITKIRLAAAAIFVTLASMMTYGYVYLLVNGLSS